MLLTSASPHCMCCNAIFPALRLPPLHPACVPLPPPTTPQGDALTVIAWDERMELHEEAGASASMHPERPDRVRAVMARLQVRVCSARCGVNPCMLRAAVLHGW